MWQAMLMSAQLPASRQIFIHGFITMNGQKMSKSTGNVVNPFELVEKYGTDAVRYYLLREIPSLDDGDFSFDRMNQVYESDLANELGNLVSRVTTLAATDGIQMVHRKNSELKYKADIEQFNFNKILENIWNDVKALNKMINEKEPWKLNAGDRAELLAEWLMGLHTIAAELLPFLPDTADKIMNATNGKIEKITPLFPRLKK
jgi:methionyl-tRNA synthetase